MGQTTHQVIFAVLLGCLPGKPLEELGEVRRVEGERLGNGRDRGFVMLQLIARYIHQLHLEKIAGRVAACQLYGIAQVRRVDVHQGGYIPYLIHFGTLTINYIPQMYIYVPQKFGGYLVLPGQYLFRDHCLGGYGCYLHAVAND